VLEVGVVEVTKVRAMNNQTALPLAIASTVSSASERRFKVLFSISLRAPDRAHICLSW